jgi:hypothetical protein
MTVIIPSDEQARLIGEANSPIVLVDSNGRQVGEAKACTPLPPDATEDEVVAEIKRRMTADDARRFTHAEVMDHLRSLAPE